MFFGVLKGTMVTQQSYVEGKDGYPNITHFKKEPFLSFAQRKRKDIDTFYTSQFNNLVKYYEYKYATSLFGTKINGAFEVMGGFLKNFFNHPGMTDAVVVLETPQDSEGIKIKPLTVVFREGKIKIMSGMPPEEMITAKLYADVGKQFRDFTNLLPYPHTKKGKRKVLPKLFKKFVFGGIKLSGSFKVRTKLIKSFLQPDDRTINNLIVPPLFHLGSYAFFTMFYTYVSGAYIMPKNRSFSAEEILSQIDDFKPGWIFLVPAMYKKILDELEKKPDHGLDLSSVNLGLSGASLFRAKYKKMLLKHFKNMIVFDAFGQTEMAPVATIKLDGEVETISDRSVGKPVQGVELKIFFSVFILFFKYLKSTPSYNSTFNKVKPSILDIK